MKIDMVAEDCATLRLQLKALANRAFKLASQILAWQRPRKLRLVPGKPGGAGKDQVNQAQLAPVVRPCNDSQHIHVHAAINWKR